MKDAPHKTLLTKASQILGRLFDAIFGYDFFISYTWADGADYARDLHGKLTAQGFTVFLDTQDYAGGDNWTLLGRRAVKKTRQLVLVGTPKVHESAAVLDEVEAFSKTGRRIIPVQFGDSLDPLRYAKSRLLALIPPTLLKITEGLQQDKIPDEVSRETIRELRKGFSHVRQSKKRIRILVGVCMSLLALLALASWAGLIAKQKATEARSQEQEARKQEQQAKYQEEQGRKTFALSDFYRADELVAADKRQAALAYLARALRSDPGNPTIAKRALFLLRQHPWFVPQVSYFKQQMKIFDAKFVANDRLLFLGGEKEGISVFSDKGAPLFTPIPISIEAIEAQFSEDGKLFETSRSGTSTYYDSLTGERRPAPSSRALPEVSAEVKKTLSKKGKVAVSTKGGVAFGNEDGNISIVWSDGRTEAHKVDFPVLVLRFSEDGLRLLVGGGSGIEFGRFGGVAFFSFESGVVGTRSNRPLASEVLRGAFQSDGLLAVTVCQDRSSQLWDTRTGYQLATLSRDVSSAAFDPRGGAIIVGGTPWRSVGSRPKGRVFDKDIADFVFAPNASELVTLSGDGAVRVWDPKSGALLSFEAGEAGVKRGDPQLLALLSDDAKAALVVSENNTGRYINRDSHKAFSLQLAEKVLARHVSSAEAFVVIKAEEALARMINLVTGETNELSQSSLLENAEFDLAASKLIGICSKKGEPTVLRVWNTHPPLLVGEFPVSDSTTKVVPSRGGKFGLIANGEVQIWDLATLKLIGHPMPHPNPVGSAHFDAREQQLITATGSPDSSVRIWNAMTGTAIIEPISLPEDENQAWFTPDGASFITYSASGGTDVGTVQIWDRITGRCLSEPIGRDQLVDDSGQTEPLRGDRFPITKAKMSQDGRFFGRNTLN